MFALALDTAMGSRWRNLEGGHVYLRQQLVNWAQYPCKRGSFIQAGEQAFRLNILSERCEIPQLELQTQLLTVALVDITFYIAVKMSVTWSINPPPLHGLFLKHVHFSCTSQTSAFFCYTAPVHQQRRNHPSITPL